MIFRGVTFVTIWLGLVSICFGAEAGMSDQEVYSTFMQANDAFRKGNSLADDHSAAQQYYAQAILGYERIINGAKISNSKLFYNLANAYMLKGDIGRAILNYRNAEKLDRTDADIQKNLAFARSQRLDTVDVAAGKKVLERLFFWHYGLSMKAKLTAACIAFAVACLLLTTRIWFPAVRGTLVLFAAMAIVTLCLATSVVVDRHFEVNNRGGVIVAESVEARTGDGAGYPLSFKEPLHAGTEFEVIEQRPGWWHIRLADEKDAWIPDVAAELILL